MANELDLSCSMRFIKGKMDVELSASGRLTITGTQYVKYNQVITQAAEVALEIGTGIGTLGYILVKNLDPTNFFEIRQETGAAFDCIKVPPGLFALFHAGSNMTAPFALADTADCEAEIFILEV